MVKHIVMFQFRADVPEEVRSEAARQFKAGIEALPAIIPTIREIRVGFNVNPAEKWDICLDSAFDTLEDVKTYGAILPTKQSLWNSCSTLVPAPAPTLKCEKG